MTSEVEVKEECRELNVTMTFNGFTVEANGLIVKGPPLYDMKGVLIATDQDICDCDDENCPGCFNPCKLCTSNKCGHICRTNRRWRYEKHTVNDGASTCPVEVVTNGENKENIIAT